MSERPYNEAIADLAEVYLEDSYVLGFSEELGLLSFEMDFVLTENHPFYVPPKAGEQYCYRRGALSFVEPRDVVWDKSELPPATDASGQTDYGNIDTFSSDGAVYRLEGDWGKLQLAARRVMVLFDS